MATQATATQATSRPARALVAETPRAPRPVHIIRQAIVYLLLCIGGGLVLIPILWMISTSLKTQDQLFTGQIQFIPQPAAPENYITVWDKLSSIAPGMT